VYCTSGCFLVDMLGHSRCAHLSTGEHFGFYDISIGHYTWFVVTCNELIHFGYPRAEEHSSPLPRPPPSPGIAQLDVLVISSMGLLRKWMHGLVMWKPMLACLLAYKYKLIQRTGMCSQSCKLTSAVHIRTTKKSCPYTPINAAFGSG
jgi:hypothetical protein